LSLPSGLFNTGGYIPLPDSGYEGASGGEIRVMLYCCETAGSGFANSFDDSNCESASGFEFALGVVRNVKTLPLIPFEDSTVLNVSEAG
jgi:hypothetical protein